MTPPASLRSAALVTLLLLGATVSESALPKDSREGSELSVRYSQTGTSDLEAAGPAGSVAVDSFQLGVRAGTPLTDATRLLYGVDWTDHRLDLPGRRWLPERLQAVALPLGVAHRWDERWQLLATLQPRLASAGSILSSSSLDVPVMVLGNYTATPELAWTFGLRYGARSDIKVLPIAGVVWRFAPEWDFRLAWPDSGLSYRATPQLTLRAVATFHGGDYRLAEDPRAPADRNGASLDHAGLEYREVRVGLAAEYNVGRGVNLRAGFGQVVGQRFAYLDRGLRLKGETPAYFALGAVARF